MWKPPDETKNCADRERVLTAEGEKKAYTLKSEGVKVQLINESEGHLIQVQNAAKATKDRLRLEAEVRARFLLFVVEEGGLNH